MFGNTDNSAPATDQLDTDMEMLSMDALMGESVSDVELLKAKFFPSGFYMLTLADTEDKTYEIKKEDHPMVGQEALQINLKFGIVAIDDSGQTEYLAMNKKGKFDKVPASEVASHVGEEITESIFFGDDQVLDDSGNPKMRGRKQLRTLLHKFIGEANAAELGFDLETATFREMLEGAKKVNCIVPIANRKDYRDESRIQSSIDLLADFMPQPVAA